MLQSVPSSPSASAAESRPDSGDLSVEPVATPARGTSRATTLAAAARLERLRRLVLELRVAALEAKLERARRRRAAVIEHYEELLEEQQSSADRPAFSWLGR